MNPFRACRKSMVEPEFQAFCLYVLFKEPAFRLLLGCVVFCSLWTSAAAVARISPDMQLEQRKGRRREVTVADGITMGRIAHPVEELSPDISIWSPNGELALVVVKRGDLKNNCVDYSLLLWRRAELFHGPKSQVLLTFSSSSNRDGIRDVRWIDDERLTFLGERIGEEQQLYAFNIHTRTLAKLISHPTSLDAYATSAKGTTIAFAAQVPVTKLFTKNAERHGINVSTELVYDLIAGDNSGQRGKYGKHGLFLKQLGHYKVIPLNTLGNLSTLETGLWLSPNGKYLLVKSQRSQIPRVWADYQIPFLQNQIRSAPIKGYGDLPSGIPQYELIDTSTGTAIVLLDAPIGYTAPGVAWSPDSGSVVLSDVYLPLDINDSAARTVRESTTFSVEIRVPSKEILEISSEHLRVIAWDEKTNKVSFEIVASDGTPLPGATNTYYRKQERQWEKVGPASDKPGTAHPRIVVEEDLNTPPTIVAIDPTLQQKSLLLDLNPQFKELLFGMVEKISWKAADGHELTGGLYLPPNYIPGKRYPLVIQTHGFNPASFSINGSFPTAFAGRALAAKDIIVLQAPMYLGPDGLSPQREVSSYEAAIDYLNGLGMIDSSRVGIIGFSWTCLATKYALVHSHHRFAAAVVADGIDGGYFQYITYANSAPNFVAEIDGINGGPPFGSTLSSWLKLSPGFNLDKVSAPILIQAMGRRVLAEWEWFSGLWSLGKPVDMLYLPDADHLIVKPWEQLTSQQTTLDWFCFWLNGEEDSSPEKVEQYTRWRQLRKMQEENDAKDKAAKEKGSASVN